MEVIELADDDDDEVDFGRPLAEVPASGMDDEFTSAGFGINDAEEGDTDLDSLDTADGADASDMGADDDFLGEDNYGDGDFDE